MKNVKLGLFALVSIIGIGSAFASSQKEVKNAKFTTFHAISDGVGGFTWSSTIPSGYSCVQSTPYCTAVPKTGVTLQTNTVPNDTDLTSHSASHSLFRQN